MQCSQDAAAPPPRPSFGRCDIRFDGGLRNPEWISLQERVTLAVIKPDLAHEPDQQRAIFEAIEKNGFQIHGGGRPLQWTREAAEKFYAEHRGRFFYQRLIAFMTSGPIIPMVLERDNAVAEWRCVLWSFRTH